MEKVTEQESNANRRYRLVKHFEEMAIYDDTNQFVAPVFSFPNPNVEQLNKEGFACVCDTYQLAGVQPMTFWILDESTEMETFLSKADFDAEMDPDGWYGQEASLIESLRVSYGPGTQPQRRKRPIHRKRSSFPGHSKKITA